MDFITNINNQYSHWSKGLITYTEMLQSISQIVENEMPRRIEYRKGKKGAWKVFTDVLYTKEESADELERLSYNTLGLEFRAVMAN